MYISVCGGMFMWERNLETTKHDGHSPMFSSFRCNNGTIRDEGVEGLSESLLFVGPARSIDRTSSIGDDSRKSRKVDVDGRLNSCCSYMQTRVSPVKYPSGQEVKNFNV